MRIMPTLNAQSRQPASPKFTGQAEYEAFKKRLHEFPTDSMERLAEIKREEVAEAPAHNKHVQLAIKLGKVDTHIQWLNAQILKLIGERRNGKGLSKETPGIISAVQQNPGKQPEEIQASAKEYLADLRKAQDDELVERGFTTEGEKA